MTKTSKTGSWGNLCEVVKQDSTYIVSIARRWVFALDIRSWSQIYGYVDRKTGRTSDYIAQAAQFLTQYRRVLCLGGGLCMLSFHLRNSELTFVDHNSIFSRVVDDYLPSNHRLVVQDFRAFLKEQESDSYDACLFDVFDGPSVQLESLLDDSFFELFRILNSPSLVVTNVVGSVPFRAQMRHEIETFTKRPVSACHLSARRVGIGNSLFLLQL